MARNSESCSISGGSKPRGFTRGRLSQRIPHCSHADRTVFSSEDTESRSQNRHRAQRRRGSRLKGTAWGCQQQAVLFNYPQSEITESPRSRALPIAQLLQKPLEKGKFFCRFCNILLSFLIKVAFRAGRGWHTPHRHYLS